MRGIHYNGEPRQDNPRYRGGSEYAASMKVYMDQISELNTNGREMDRLKRNLMVALQDDVTPRQCQMLLLYYGKRLNMREIGEMLGVDKSTVSRTVKRGVRNLQRCLKYGAGRLLVPEEED